MELLNIEKKDDVIVVRFEKNVNKFNALISEEVKAKMTALFDKPNTKLVLSLEGINYVDSSGFGVFLSLMKTANNNYSFFRISNINDEVMELFKLLQLHNVFDICPTVDECLKTFPS